MKILNLYAGIGGNRRTCLDLSNPTKFILRNCVENDISEFIFKKVEEEYEQSNK